MNDIDRLVRLFETFAPSDIDRLQQWYMPDARFRDPFSSVSGLAAIQEVYRHMFDALENPRFAVRHRAHQADQCFLMWDFTFGLRGEVHVVQGVSHLQLSADGRIADHRDHWDSADLYECFPVLRSLMRWLRRRAGTRDQGQH